MDSRVIKLIERFEQAGWKSHRSADMTSDWWYEDIILLISERPPHDTPLYLTLLTDPMFADKKVVWAVNISTSLPEQGNLKSIRQITLNDINRIDLTKLVKETISIVLESRTQ